MLHAQCHMQCGIQQVHSSKKVATAKGSSDGAVRLQHSFKDNINRLSPINPSYMHTTLTHTGCTHNFQQTQRRMASSPTFMISIASSYVLVMTGVCTTKSNTFLLSCVTLQDARQKPKIIRTKTQRFNISEQTSWIPKQRPSVMVTISGHCCQLVEAGTSYLPGTRPARVLVFHKDM